MRFVLFCLMGFCAVNLTSLSAMSESEVGSAISKCLHNDDKACKAVVDEYEAEILSLKECDIQTRRRENFYMDCMETGFVLFGAQRYEKAIWYLKKALDNLEEGSNESYQPMFANHRIGISYQKLGDMKNAKWYLTLACQEDYPFSCVELKKMRDTPKNP